MYITYDRIKALEEIGIIVQDEQILNQLFCIIAQTDSWNRPTLIAETNGEWCAFLKSHDAHFRDEYRVKANTPENAMADLILTYVRDLAKDRAQKELGTGFYGLIISKVGGKRK